LVSGRSVGQLERAALVCLQFLQERLLTELCKGRVRIARHTKTKQYAAVKIVSKNALVNSRMSLSSLAEDHERVLLGIEREIVIMKLIDHPNIMRLYDVWETSTELYLILEYVEGGELFDYICENGRLSTSEALGYFQQIIAAVDYCHHFNIAHRDLKPENLLLDGNKNIKVADFGMAAWQKSNSNGMLKTACGSPHYAAPEVVAGTPYNGSASDIWSCGIVLFALLAGKLPFDDDDLATLLEKVKVAKFEIPSHIDRQAKHLISRMLEKDVQKRITMPEILVHPFFTSRPPKPTLVRVPDLAEIAKPIARASDIDPDLFDNLRTLWNDAPDQQLIRRLINPERTWEKAVYYLLVQYRARRLENYDEEEEIATSTPNGHYRRDSIRPTSPFRAPDAPRPSPPTPSRVMKSRVKAPVPEIMLHSASPTKRSPRASLPTHYGPTPTVSPLVAGSPIQEAFNLPPLNVPEMQDARIQQFFQQVIDHLNVMNVRATGFASPAASPNPSWPPTPGAYSDATGSSTTPSWFIPTPVSAEFDHRFPRVVDPPSPRTYQDRLLSPLATPTIGEAQVFREDTEPLALRRHSTKTKTKQSTGKENRTYEPLVKKSSLKKPQDKKTKSDRRVRVLEPTENKLRKRPNTVDVGSPLFSDAEMGLDDGLPAETIPRRGFFGLFGLRPTVLSLFSVHDAFTTQKECRRLLEKMGVRVSVPHSADLGLLKCRLDELRDPAGAMGVVKPVRFRVEIRKASDAQGPTAGGDGHGLVLAFVQEKGAASSFKAVFARLKRDWELDVPSGWVSEGGQNSEAMGDELGAHTFETGLTYE
jgi:serine/threonine-protein kinase HSL1 (negative regulator of Swe1 kinase)